MNHKVAGRGKLVVNGARHAGRDSQSRAILLVSRYGSYRRKAAWMIVRSDLRLLEYLPAFLIAPMV